MLLPGVVEAFRLQAEFCATFGSPLYAQLLAHAAEDIERGGPVAQVVDDWTGNPFPDALALRLMGGVHRLVLDGAAPQLARFYPSVGGDPEWPAVGAAFLRVVDAHAATLRAALDQPVQTNEVRRSAALLGGFLTVSAACQLPLRLLEIGSSAGLNLCWDGYRYEVTPPAAEGTAAALRPVWGDPGSPVTIHTEWTGPLDIFGTAARVDQRAGCDLAPVDVTDPTQVRRLESFVWPDQIERLAHLRAAVDLVRRRTPPALSRRSAAHWLGEQLAEPRAGVATIVFHSIMWWYLSEAERDRVTAIIRGAGERATAHAPVAWLRLELMDATESDLRLTRWPDGQELVLGRADSHGRYVHWASHPRPV